MGLSNVLKKGEYLNSDWIFGELSYELSPLNYEVFDNSNTTLCAVATNALTGKPEYFYPKDFRNGCDELKASCSLPAVTKGVTIGGQVYFDGGLVDSIPLKRALDDGCQKAVVILTQHKGYEKEPMPKRLSRAFHKYPKIGEAVVNRHIMYNNQLKYVHEMQESGLAYVIQPTVQLGATTLEKDTAKLESIYKLGYMQGEKNADNVIEFIK
jgi:predicted patatin/cPLA2 family phospholipase